MQIPAPVVVTFSMAVRAGAAAAALERIPASIMVMSLLQPKQGHLTQAGAGVVLMRMSQELGGQVL
jgi:hypothetical protein